MAGPLVPPNHDAGHDAGPGDGPGDERITPQQWALARRCLWILGGLGLCSALGIAFSLVLVNEAPLLLIALSPLGRHLVLAAPTVDPFAFVTVAVLRRMAFYLACFQLGRALGPYGVEWLEQQNAWLGRFVRWLEGLFARAGHLVVLVFAGPTVSTLAGISGMHLGVFAGLAALGLIARMLLIVGFAEWLREPIEMLLGLAEEYWLPGTVVLVTGVSLQQWRRLRKVRAAGGMDALAD
ncbi:MAG: hypothetical protein QNK05_11610 [Myxococcota bacterium]|nr:hypothetical protein [Myxococcota bacterium]